jgi:MFS family permease
MIGNGLEAALLGIRSRLEGFSTTVTGLIMASFYVGFLASAALAPRFVRRVGHVRVFAALASLATAAALIHALIVTPVAWALLRFVTGFCFAGLYVVVESWFNGLSTNQTRGRLLATYMVASMGGLAVGQFIIGTGDPEQFGLFATAAIVLSLSVFPLALASIDPPEFEEPVHISIAEIYRTSPLGVVGSILVGMGTGAVLALGAVYAIEIGLTNSQAGQFMGVGLLGCVLFQLPIGALSDRYRRAAVIFWVTIIALGVALVAANDLSFSLRLATMFVFGGLTLPLYSLVMSHINDLLPLEKVVGASALIVSITGVGSIVGPIVTSVAMEQVGPNGFWLTQAVIAAALAGFVVYRYLARSQVPAALQRHFAPLPARTALFLTAMFQPRERDEEG